MTLAGLTYMQHKEVERSNRMQERQKRDELASKEQQAELDRKNVIFKTKLENTSREHIASEQIRSDHYKQWKDLQHKTSENELNRKHQSTEAEKERNWKGSQNELDRANTIEKTKLESETKVKVANRQMIGNMVGSVVKVGGDIAKTVISPASSGGKAVASAAKAIVKTIKRK